MPIDIWSMLTTDKAKDLNEPAWKFIRLHENDDPLVLLLKGAINIFAILPIFLVFWLAVSVAISVSFLGMLIKYISGFKE